ncbi:hypothetical protein DSO57_1014426 [Entomophthora muscae]|uniref:Uncharacterized protein n=1 Tax=Entomophthora muscae TaxID=34485 RepID=A0ACC2US22_9FUNG|nr:hypothetical protein DSO57_1014426 [Entomophthora muscae]
MVKSEAASPEPSLALKLLTCLKRAPRLRLSYYLASKGIRVADLNSNKRVFEVSTKASKSDHSTIPEYQAFPLRAFQLNYLINPRWNDTSKPKRVVLGARLGLRMWGSFTLARRCDVDWKPPVVEAWRIACPTIYDWN